MTEKTTVNGRMLLVAATAIVVLLVSSLLIVTSTITLQAQQNQTSQTNQANQTPPIKLKTFESPILGYSIQYPQNWRLGAFNPSTDWLALNGTTDILVIIHVRGLSPFPPEITIHDQLNILTDGYKTDANYSFINSTIINPPQVYQPAVKIMEYNLSIDKARKEMVVFIADNNAAKAFAIRYSAPPANFTTFLPVVNEMVKSFRPVQVR